MLPEIFDSHAHISKEFFGDDCNAVIERAEKAGVTNLVTIGSGSAPSEMEEAIEVAEKYHGVYAAVGIHPHNADKADHVTWSRLEELLKHPKVVALGEVGLDFYYNLSPPQTQKMVFERAIHLAKSAGKPIIIHCREAHQDCLEILKGCDLKENQGVIHCFTADFATAQRYLDLGFFISIPGVVTFPNSTVLQKAVERIPIERMLVETDAPFLAPVPMRGKKNEPAFIVYTIEMIAKLKRLSYEDIARITSLNTKRVFRLPLDKGSLPKLVYAIRDSLYINMTNRCTLHCTFCGKFRDFYVKGHNLKIGKDAEKEEILDALKKEDLNRYKEIVFCGYGEPLLRIDDVKEIAKVIKDYGKKVRVNTDGLANLVHGRNVLVELAGLVDTISVSLNAQDAKTYAKYCHSKYGEKAFFAVLDFIREAKRYIPDVWATIVTLDGVDIEACRKLAEGELGVKFRVRPYNDLG